MTDNLVISKQDSLSKRRAIFEDDGTSAWLYMTEPESEKIIADCFVYNLIPPILDAQVKEYSSNGNQPPISKTYASKFAQISVPINHEIEVEWCPRGLEIVVKIDGNMWSRLKVGEKNGKSKSVGKDGPFGYPL